MGKKQSRQEREKLQRRDAIISAAEKIFYKNGFENSSMDEIARESEFTIRTLYQYFLNKEDLFLAVVERGYQKAYSFMEGPMKSGKNGYQKIRAFLFAYYKFNKEFPELNHLVSYLSYIKPNKENALKHQRLQQFMKESMDEMKSIIEEGKADGSISSAIDTEKASYAIYFSLKSFFHEVNTSGKSLPDQEDFSLFAIDLLSNAFLGNKNSG